MDLSLPIKICSYNCKGFKFRNNEYIRKVLQRTDFLFLQETWLYDFETHVFDTNLPNCQFMAKSAMKNDSGHMGRPYGGVALIWKKSLSFKVENISTISKRLCAVKAKSNEVDIILLNLYMPCNEGIVTNEEFFDILCEVASICYTYGDCDIILGGDFNCDIAKADLRVSLFQEFIQSNGFLVPTLDPQYAIRYTFMNSLNQKSHIDHFCISSSLAGKVLACHTHDDGDNLSDHCPVVIEINVKCKYEKIYRSSRDSLKEKVQWGNASELDKDNFRHLLNEMLDNIHIPFEALHCLDLHCIRHSTEFRNYLYQIVESLELATIASVPVKKMRGGNESSNLVVGWNAYVKNYRNQSIFWHNLWKDCGRPIDGLVCQIRRTTRFNYHKAIEQVKRNADNIKRDRVANKLKKGNSKFFWNEISSLKARDSVNTNIIDGKKGKEACNIFCSKYEVSYSKGRCDNLSETLEKLTTDITNACQNNHSNNVHNLHYITTRMVSDAIKKLNRGKKDDCNEIYTDSIIEAPRKLHVHLSFLLTIMMRHGLSDDIFDVIVFSPLVKNKRKDLSSSDNYRAIALNSALGKLLDYIIIDYFRVLFQSSDYQFAYKKCFSTSMCSFMVMETVQYYVSRGSNVLAALLDCSKAFDRIRYKKLFNILICRGLCPLVTRLLVKMYSTIEAKIKWNDIYSDRFKIKNGVKQGGVMSPLLFTLYVDVLITKLIDTNVGCYIGNVCSAVFVYADDIILLSPTRRAMQILLDVCESFGTDYDLTFNPDKCEAIIFGDENVPVKLRFCRSELEFVNKIKHLRHVMTNTKCIFDKHSMITDMMCRTNSIFM